MQAAQQEGVFIPHFCWHPGLSIAGVCRFCMVKVEGRPKMEISCNLTATEGMEVSTDAPDVQETHKWALEFHLVNHPLDCPICDQAGECGLQDYYMSVGKYKSQMERPKVLKPKAMDVGDELVLDSERCILCDRCVRFEKEVTKTDALGIFDRGDRAIVGPAPGKKIDHNYQANLVDICPVGAFTSKDFRFKQRVWFLDDKPSVCTGCSTGCHVDVYAKTQTRRFFRVKPRFAKDVNGHWMCDKGRHVYEPLNKENRLLSAINDGHKASTDDALEKLARKIQQAGSDKTALLVSAQYTSEEYKALFDFFVSKMGIKNVFQWREPTEKIDDFDGVLYRGDHNANTRGLQGALKDAGLSDGVKNGFDDVARLKPEVLVALAPEQVGTFPSLPTQLQSLAELDFVSLWTINRQAQEYKFSQLVPTLGFAEKTGTFINHDGREGKLEAPFPKVVKDSFCVESLVQKLSEAYNRNQAG